jgi:hypothetical protein
VLQIKKLTTTAREGKSAKVKPLFAFARPSLFPVFLL